MSVSKKKYKIIRTKDEKYLIVQILFYIVSRKIVENYEKLTKNDIINNREQRKVTKFLTPQANIADGRLFLYKMYETINPYGYKTLMEIYRLIDKNWNIIDGKKDLTIRRSGYLFKNAKYIYDRIPLDTKQLQILKPQITDFRKYWYRKNELLKVTRFKKNDIMKLYINLTDDVEINILINFLKNLNIIFSGLPDLITFI